MKWCEITCWLEELPHALLFYFCCLSCADQHPLVKNRYTMRTQIFSKRYRMTPNFIVRDIIFLSSALIDATINHW